jgi:hypothetical protein
MCSSQCYYDLVVATPPGQPDTVVVAGVQHSTFAEATIRSTNAGEGFSTFGSDAQATPNRSHVDVRAVVFHPRNPDIAFVGSDGGVVRSDGNFTDARGRCATQFVNIGSCQTMFASIPAHLYFLNKGLQTLQFYNVALDPQQPLKRLIGGLQDNGTIWQDGTGDPLVWKALFPSGDGTSASGFHPTNPAIVFASVQSNLYFVNFQNGDGASWVRMYDPIQAAGERESVTASTGRQFLTFDRARPNTQFTAFQHVWRTQNNGGDQAFLEANCKLSGGAPAGICGDWVPLGVAYPFQAGSNPDSASRKPGDLTSDFYGTDRTGGLIVSAGAHVRGYRHVMGRHEHGPPLRGQSRGRSGRRGGIRAHRHAGLAKSIRHPHRRRSLRSECRVHFVFGLQRADTRHAGPHFPRGLQPGHAPGVIHLGRL